MELWKVTLIWFVTLIAKSFAFLWALNELFELGIEYSFLSVLASLVFLFCLNGGLPSISQSGTRSNDQILKTSKTV